MRYINPRSAIAVTEQKTGVLIANLGTPDEATPKAVKRYLKQFLSDPRVVEFPRALWWLILNGVILPIRSGKSAAAYKTVFDEQGSPLLFHTRNQATAIASLLKQQGHQDIIVDFAMRYGNPGIPEVLQKLFDQGVTRLLVLPMYPQYSGSTTASILDAISQDFRQRRNVPDFRFIRRYLDYPAFIDAAAERIQQHWQQHGRAEKLLFSYHGIPKRYQKNGDPYYQECLLTSTLLARRLELTEQDYLTTFQSRFGREEWLQPYTDFTLKALPAQGVTSVQVFCPGFSADCLETLEEIANENRHYFEEAGGKRYEYISALNDSPAHIQALTQLITENLQGW